MSLRVRVLEAMAARLPSRSIVSYGSEYLRIHYVLGKKPEWAPRSRLGWLHFAVHLHHFGRGDIDPEYHTHPWGWARSLVLTGGYIEMTREPDGARKIWVVGPGAINRFDSRTAHRIADLLGDTWTLFVCGDEAGDAIARARRDDWHFIAEDGTATPWGKFIDERHGA